MHAQHRLAVPLGGGEFVALATAVGYRGGAALAEGLRRTIEELRFAEAGPITVGIGVTEYSDGESAQSRFRRADAALHAAKFAGRNRIHVDRQGRSDRHASRAGPRLPAPSVAIRGGPGSQRSPEPGLRAFSLVSGWLARLGRVPDSPGSSPTTPHLKEDMNLPTSLSRLSSLILPFAAVAAHAVSLSPTSLTLLPGNSANIVVSSVRGTATLKNSNPAAVAASLAAGTISVTANAAGVATLSVTDRSGTKTAKVTVKPPLGVSPGSASLLVGQSATLTVSNAIGTLAIGNSNSAAVGASLSGNIVTVTGRGAGSAELTVRDTKSTVKAQVTVTSAPSSASGDIHPGRLLASNCFQCHGTNGSGGFDRLQGSTKADLLDELRGFASGREDAGGIMAAHAAGYTDEQLQLIADFLSKQ